MLKFLIVLLITAVIGVFFFFFLQKDASDSKRKTDINNIALVLENNYDDGKGIYRNLDVKSFDPAFLPIDPNNGGSSCGNEESTDPLEKSCWYCVNDRVGLCSSKSVEISFTKPANGIQNWIICANLESSKTGYYCKQSSR